MQLYTVITVALGSQHIYYGYVYPQLKYKRQLEVKIPILFVAYNVFYLYMLADYNIFQNCK